MCILGKQNMILLNILCDDPFDEACSAVYPFSFCHPIVNGCMHVAQQCTTGDTLSVKYNLNIYPDKACIFCV